MNKQQIKKLEAGDTKTCNDLPGNTATPAFEPTWEKFCASLHDATGKVVPNQNDPLWRQYFNCYAIGYVAALRAVMNYQERTTAQKNLAPFFKPAT